MINKDNAIMPNSYGRFYNMLYQTCWIDARRLTLELFDSNARAVFLDYGCNKGEVTREIMHKLGVMYAYGIDVRDTTKELVDGRIKMFVVDLNKDLPIASSTIDVINASNIIEHVSDTDTFICEMHRVLKHNGYAVITTCNLAAWHNIPFLMVGRQIPAADVSDKYSVGGFGKPTFKKEVGPHHRRLFTMRALCELFQCYGFSVEKKIGMGYYPFTGRLANILCKIDKMHAAYIAIKVRKQ